MSDPLRTGSRGAGFSIDRGVTTQVHVEGSDKLKAEITINGKPADARTSRRVLELYAERLGPFSARVSHKVAMPIGAGFGTSGAGALSLSLALNEALNAGLSRIEAAQLAHIAEVLCKTGLGTVLAELFGGFEIRVEAGAPGIGRIVRIPFVNSYKVICASFEPLSTEVMLSKPSLLRAVCRTGRECLEKLLAEPSIERFVNLSRTFAEGIGLLRGSLKSIVRALNEQGISSSAAMFGTSLFAFVDEDRVADAIRILEKMRPEHMVICDLEPDGARTL